MRRLYRQRMIYCGNYLEVEIFPVFKKSTGKRSGRSKPTSEMQKKINKNNSVRKLVRLLNTNFTAADYRFDLTYSSGNLPESDEQALKNQKNFLRRAKYMYQKAGAELKYVAAIEKSSRGRYHHHIIISGGVSLRALAECWGMGLTQARPLQFDEHGIEGIARYITKAPLLFKRWSASKNLKKPTIVEKDGRLSAATVEEMCHNANKLRTDYETFVTRYFSAAAGACSAVALAHADQLSTDIKAYKKTYAKRYSDYTLSNAQHSYDPFNGGYYLQLRLYDAKAVYNHRKNKNNKSDSINYLAACGGLFAEDIREVV